MNVADSIFLHAQARPDNLALVTSSERFSWSELEEKVDHTTALLDHHGIRSGQRVAITLRHQVLHLFVSLALARLGATQVALPPSDSLENRERLSKQLGLAAVVAERSEDTIKSISSVVFKLSDLNAHKSSPKNLFQAGRDQGFLLLQSSGTTGDPKFAELTHQMSHDRYERYKTYFHTRADDIFWPASKLDFVVAKQRTYHSLQAGAAVCIVSDRAIDTGLVEYLDAAGVTLACGTPSHMIQLVEASSTQIALPKLRAFEVRSATVTEALRQNFRAKVSPNLFIAYATNEAEAVTIASPDLQSEVADTVGLPTEGMLVEVVDENRIKVPTGEAGQIRIKGKGVVSSYLENPNASQKSFHEGWFYPGDNGRFEGDALVFLGRSDDMMIFDGMNIYPVEIENVLMAHPAVKEAAALPLGHRKYQDVPVAAVVTRSTVTAKELLSHCRAALGFKAPVSIKIVDRFPVNPMGKTMKRELRKVFLDPQPAVATSIFKHSLPLAQASLYGPNSNLKFKFLHAETASIETLDAWLRILNPDVSIPAFSITLQDGDPERDRALDYLQRLILLVREFMDNLRIPIFPPIEIVEFDRSKPADKQDKYWRVSCLVPNASLAPPKVIIGSVQAALELFDWFSEANLSSQDDLNLFFEKIQNVVLKKFSSFLPTRKSTFEVLRVADSLNIPYQMLAGGVFQLGWGVKSRCVEGSITDADSAIGQQLAANKLFSSEVLRNAGLPVPRNKKVGTVKQARSVAEAYGYPVVIKPADLERGEGVSVDVYEKDLSAALKAANKLSPRKVVLVEEQASGTCHRLFISAGALLYAVKRMPTGFYADGVSSVSTLVAQRHSEQMRMPPWKRSGIWTLDEKALAILAAQGLTPSSVVPSGAFVSLRRIETTLWGGVDEDVTQSVHPENVKAAIQAAHLFGLETAGVDIMSVDISKPWHANGAVINEVNFAPLLGGGEISKHYLEKYLGGLVQDDGRIPIEVFIGGKAAWDAALKRHAKLSASVDGVFVSSATRSLSASGEEVHMPFKTLAKRSRALLMSSDVCALILVVQDDGLVYSELPFDKTTHLVAVDSDVKSSANQGGKISIKELERLHSLLSPA